LIHRQMQGNALKVMAGGPFVGDLHMDYLDFAIEISSGSGRDYLVAVVRSPAGEAHETMCFPFGELELRPNAPNRKAVEEKVS
jgi:hypothetical protein